MNPVYIPFQDLQRSSLENQFSVLPADTLFTETDKIFCITEIEAGGAFTLTYKTVKGVVYTRGGSGNTQYFNPICFQTLVGSAGITKLSGFWLKINKR